MIFNGDEFHGDVVAANGDGVGMVCLFACLAFNSTFSTNRLFCSSVVGNISRRDRRQHRHIIKQ